MARPRRRLIVGVLAAVALACLIPAMWIGMEWKQALDDVQAMTVPTVVIPTPTHSAVVRPAGDAAPPPTPSPTAVPSPDQPVNILLLGTDARVGAEASRTDVLIVVRIDPQSERVGVLSLPRDLWVDVPGYGKHKLNAAYPIGERELGPGYGPALAKRTVGELLGLPIDHFVLINFEGFKSLIDRLGGIEVDVPREIVDPSYPVDAFEGDTRTIEIKFSKGRQRLSGERALIYARTRHVDSDFGRNQRQQQVLLAIFERIRERGLLAQLTSLDDYTGALRDYIRLDLTRQEMLGLASLGPQLRAENIQRYAVDSSMVMNLKPPATFAADPKLLRQLVEEMLGDPVAAAEEPGTP